MSEYQLKTGKVGEAVVGTYKKIEESVVGGYKKIENTVAGGYKKIEDKFVETFLEKAEKADTEEAKAGETKTE